ncbi:MAG: acyl-ACP--UDP-N-acetylglucosamine O-acyltransferase, partial [Planctomycetia bacterium]|nr:acyl-ACP--UDP-N-acetylglucosamine O-acyltransferase [Planctomycetia bacterium]
MSRAPSARIHPTAVISPEAELADDVVVGPFAVIEGAVKIGPGCVLRPYVHLCGPLTMGAGNLVYSGAVLGERPQHMKYNDEPTSTEIGDHNIFREHVTVHRGTTQSWATRIGSHNFFMAHSHVAHDCQLGSRVVMANGALLGGHCTIQDGVFISGNAALHQFCIVGRLAMLSGGSINTKDVPPFAIQQGINAIMGVNVVGMRRAGLANDQINAVRQAYRMLFHTDDLLSVAAERVANELGMVDAV